MEGAPLDRRAALTREPRDLNGAGGIAGVRGLGDEGRQVGDRDRRQRMPPPATAGAAVPEAGIETRSSGGAIRGASAISGARQRPFPGIRLIVAYMQRSATAAIVFDGFTPTAPGTTAPSSTCRPG